MTTIDMRDRGCTNPGCFATWVDGVETHECQADVRRPFKVTLHDDADEQFTIRLNAYGPHDARNQVELDHPDETILAIEEDRIDDAAKAWAREYGPDFDKLAAYQAEGR